jgi:hypothetical protein
LPTRTGYALLSRSVVPILAKYSGSIVHADAARPYFFSRRMDGMRQLASSVAEVASR